MTTSRPVDGPIAPGRGLVSGARAGDLVASLPPDTRSPAARLEGGWREAAGLPSHVVAWAAQSRNAVDAAAKRRLRSLTRSEQRILREELRDLKLPARVHWGIISRGAVLRGAGQGEWPWTDPPNQRPDWDLAPLAS